MHINKYNFKLNETCKFVPYELRGEKPQLFRSCMQQHNHVLSTLITIPVFGLNPEALHYPVENNYDRLKAPLSLIEECLSIYGTEETNKTKEFGKWFFVTDTQSLAQARKFINEDLKSAFFKLDTENLERFQYKFFSYLKRSNFN